jgi:ATP-binding cassette subfamily B protein
MMKNSGLGGLCFMRVLTKHTLKIFWIHSAKYPWSIAALAVGVFALPVLQAYSPLLYRDLLNTLARGNVAENFAVARNLVFVIFGVSASALAVRRSINFTLAYFEASVMRDLMNTCYRYLQEHSASFFSSNFVGSLVTKVKRYERSFEQITDQIVYNLGRSALVTIMVLAVLLWQYRTIGIIVLGWCMAFLVFSYFYSRFKFSYDIKKARADTKTTAQLADTVTNNINIKLFTNYEGENEKFQGVTQEQFLLRKKSWNLNALGDVIQGISMITLELAIMYYAVTMWRDNLFAVGDVALLQTYLIRVFETLWDTGKNIRVTYEALADANEMTEILSLPHGVKDAPGARTLSVTSGAIRFRDVSFGYHDEAVILDDFSLAIAPGERVALIGPSGGGKSTIVKLLFRFYDVKRGEILIDGQNIAAATQDSLRRALALVPQDPILFHRSLMENIRYAKPEADDESVLRAAKLAHAHEFIASFSQGYETLVGERGVKLSGGERQRVAIARAILKDAPILVLDEATSSLDSESEMYIQDALKKLMQDRTTIVIAHRLSTIMQMDRIVVIDGGKIVEEGKHEELLKAQQGMYQRLWEIQAGGFAAA